MNSVYQFLLEYGSMIGILFLGVIIGATRELLTIWHKRLKLKHQTQTLQINSKTDIVIHDLLAELRLKTNAARVNLFQFHNGERFFTGSSIQRMSCTHESTKGGVASCEACNSGRPVSQFAPVINSMLNYDPKYHAVSDMLDSFCTKCLQRMMVTGYSTMPLCNGKHIIGFVILHWTDNYQPADDELNKIVPMIADQIESLLIRKD